VSSAIFNGTSRYSQDFQVVVERSVAIARLPILQLETDRNSLSAQSTALKTITDRVAALRGSLDSLRSSLDANPNSASTTTSGIASVSVTRAAAPGTYSLSVLSPGAVSVVSSRSDLPVVADPSAGSLSSDTSLTLSVNGEDFTITPAASSLSSLAEALNAKSAETGVTATVINAGGPAPNYQLVLQGTQLNADTIRLADTTGTLTQSVVTGAKAQYQVAGLPATIESTSKSVELAPGLTATLQGAGTTSITVARNSGSVDTAISAFVQSFNQVLDALDAQRGTSAGALAGSSVVTSVGQSLRQISGFSGSGAIQSLAALGVTYSDTGRLVFGSSAYDTSTTAKSDARNSFLDAFLQRADAITDGLDDTESGLLTATQSSLDQSLSRTNSRISEAELRVDSMRQALSARISAADALIANLEQQVSYMTNLFEAMRAANS
jgi:flagellar hook-associated protein 2